MMLMVTAVMKTPPLAETRATMMVRMMRMRMRMMMMMMMIMKMIITKQEGKLQLLLMIQWWYSNPILLLPVPPNQALRCQRCVAEKGLGWATESQPWIRMSCEGRKAVTEKGSVGIYQWLCLCESMQVINGVDHTFCHHRRFSMKVSCISWLVHSSWAPAAHQIS